MYRYYCARHYQYFSIDELQYHKVICCGPYRFVVERLPLQSNHNTLSVAGGYPRYENIAHKFEIIVSSGAQCTFQNLCGYTGSFFRRNLCVAFRVPLVCGVKVISSCKKTHLPHYINTPSALRTEMEVQDIQFFSGFQLPPTVFSDSISSSKMKGNCQMTPSTSSLSPNVTYYCSLHNLYFTDEGKTIHSRICKRPLTYVGPDKKQMWT